MGACEIEGGEGRGGEGNVTGLMLCAANAVVEHCQPKSKLSRGSTRLTGLSTASANDALFHVLGRNRATYNPIR